MAVTRRPRAPGHLSPEMKRFWLDVGEKWELDEHHVKILTGACEAWDRAQSARALVASEGVLVRDRFSQLKENPACVVERSHMALFERLIRSLGLDVDASEGIRLPPETGRRRYGT